MGTFIIHGGACNIAAPKRQLFLDGISKAADHGIELLQRKYNALDTAESVIRILEDNPAFDAGIGSYLNLEQEVEMDAIIVDGDSGDFGSVACIRNVQNPVRVARKVMDNTNYCMLIGDGACKFALDQGVEYIPTYQLASKEKVNSAMGTVGIVVSDNYGSIAAATSTGGIPERPPGRVGDTPIIGSGALADNKVGGVSATGEGESLMKVMISSLVASHLSRNIHPMDAAQSSLSILEEKTGGKGGIICMDNQGRIGFAYNTPNMVYAYFDKQGKKTIGI